MVFLFKTALVILLLFIILNLAFALVQLVRQSDQSEEQKPMSHYLGRRVMFSAVVVVLLILALTSGLIEPNPTPQ
ncbi:DUF2909 domain-containing protein [Vibrio agarivorans]|uniref:DUF2909 domain-containing protein n=1 Tax=Vibrio agarivorans TaxID=153622 RepID=UPI00222ED0E7|nr:DUF2909 domain-containing protein [Vibrio agarivorans]MDN3660775.1 DUF2909 domain-containing protein [Vibrio agarivorans]